MPHDSGLNGMKT